mgnify:CR=1 FL=1
MTQKFIQLFTVGLLFLLSTTAVLSQQRISSPVGPPENWVRPFEGFRIIGVNGKRIRNQEQAVKRLGVLCEGVQATLSLMVA